MYRRSRPAGVTRLEVLFGALGLGVLALAASLLVGWQGEGARAKNVEDDGRRILSAAEEWQKENGELGCPSLSQLVEDSLLDRGSRTDDPWGNRFRIECDGDSIVVRSWGEDRRARTDDDVEISHRSVRPKGGDRKRDWQRS
jgi:general secretion pathway protein G